ncbi:transcriptional regulator [Rhodobacteraceae bacterium RKSG542]|uniref:TenA family protein n=1 Tax=Pseudovibrio flavus TaxID=2529854 RepID=UPI0012BD3E0F|nr:TenA family protein [Pseudovibrio flavus]MTI16812.1 transcriptional regulator [Pseudovibrio flavus]
MLQEITYALYVSQNKGATFCDWLIARSQVEWDRARFHPFTEAVGDGTVSDAAYRRYLIEDYSFIVDLASALGFLVAKAPAMKSKAVLADFLAKLTSTENDYFLRSFEALGVPAETYESADANKVTRAVAATLLATSGKQKYEDGLVCLLCAEWLYLDWCSREAVKPRPDAFYLSEWLDLHVGDYFEGFVAALKDEMNELGPQLPERRQREVLGHFQRMCQLEGDFFEAALNGVQD